MTNKLPVALAPLSALFAAPAFACGGAAAPPVNDLQLTILTASVLMAPLLAALLVDRGAFALAGYATGLKRRHRPSSFGPMLALVSVVLTLAAVGARDLDLAVVGFAFVPVAALFCAVSFVRSVAIDLRGQTLPRLLRVGAVVGFVALALTHVVR